MGYANETAISNQALLNTVQNNTRYVTRRDIYSFDHSEYLYTTFLITYIENVISG